MSALGQTEATYILDSISACACACASDRSSISCRKPWRICHSDAISTLRKNFALCGFPISIEPNFRDHVSSLSVDDDYSGFRFRSVDENHSGF